MPSVLDYGATGDGETDDTEAIQTALDAGVGYLPAGTYRFSVLSLNEGQELYGDGVGSTKLYMIGGLTLTDATGIVCKEGPLAFVQLHDFELDGNLDSYDGQTFPSRNSCGHNGINFGLSGEGPTKCHLWNLYVHDFVRNPFLFGGARPNDVVRGWNLRGANSAYDHIFYTAASHDCVIYGATIEGFWHQPAIACQGDVFAGVTVRSVRANPWSPECTDPDDVAPTFIMIDRNGSFPNVPERGTVLEDVTIEYDANWPDSYLVDFGTFRESGTEVHGVTRTGSTPAGYQGATSFIGGIDEYTMVFAARSAVESGASVVTIEASATAADTTSAARSTTAVDGGSSGATPEPALSTTTITGGASTAELS